MVKVMLVRLVLLAAASALAAALLPDLTVSGGPLTYVWVALLFAVVNATLGLVIRLVTLPLRILTLGLFSLLVNGFLLLVTDWLSDDLEIDGFFAAVLGAIVIAVINALLHVVVPDPRDRAARASA